jgi:hypothetical protein
MLFRDQRVVFFFLNSKNSFSVRATGLGPSLEKYVDVMLKGKKILFEILQKFVFSSSLQLFQH